MNKLFILTIIFVIILILYLIFSSIKEKFSDDQCQMNYYFWKDQCYPILPDGVYSVTCFDQEENELPLLQGTGQDITQFPTIFNFKADFPGGNWTSTDGNIIYKTAENGEKHLMIGEDNINFYSDKNCNSLVNKLDPSSPYYPAVQYVTTMSMNNSDVIIIGTDNQFERCAIIDKRCSIPIIIDEYNFSPELPNYLQSAKDMNINIDNRDIIFQWSFKQISCLPNCVNKKCGDDGCGGSCGECLNSYVCVNNNCVCNPDCENKQCGDDGCGGTCGDCSFCVNNMCIDCPTIYENKPTYKPTSLPSGKYKIYTLYFGITCQLMSGQLPGWIEINPAVLIMSVDLNDYFWNYDSSTGLITTVSEDGTTLCLEAKDYCTNTYCGNPSGILYAVPISTAIANKFILGNDGTFYSIDGNSYIVPDTRGCSTICPIAGDCMENQGFQCLTYSANQNFKWNFDLQSN